MSNDAQTLYRRYAGLIEPAIAAVPSFVPELEGDGVVQVERGVVFPLCLRDARDPSLPRAVDRLIELAGRGPEHLAEIDVVDRAGHRRPVYRPLLVYAWLQAYRLAIETLPRLERGRWEEGLRPWCDVLEAQASEIGWRTGGMPASLGGPATAAIWAALALHIAGTIFIRDAWTDLAADAFGQLVRAQDPAGPFLRAGPSDQPETHWFHELVLLHAAGSYAAQAEDPNVASAVARATEYHQRETQPDHATNQPWALFAFVWNRNTHLVADALLHAATMHHPRTGDGVTSLLLADALYCLRLFF